VKIHILKITYHRNGCFGEGFHSVHFYQTDRRIVMHASVFAARGHVAVHQVSMLGDLKVSEDNKWRGDVFEDALRDAIFTHIDDESRQMAASV
jgi:hypothetical protein